ncbi:hypothetical protein CEXT_329621 [Caerostris extrusa]|uniref:Uncharacterized protein n=1 Tax=Caerostris extrusa TaxID=172846 RepID=A0AAV4XLM6_CAEEX|nr:hypothetical protein CEXT_329621 [Caerostris extrusa]
MQAYSIATHRLKQKGIEYGPLKPRISIVPLFFTPRSEIVAPFILITILGGKRGTRRKTCLKMNSYAPRVEDTLRQMCNGHS